MIQALPSPENLTPTHAEESNHHQFLVCLGGDFSNRGRDSDCGQHNDWNNQRKSDKHIELLFHSLEKELEQISSIANNFIAHGYEIDQSLQQ